MGNNKKSFGQTWSGLTSEQKRYLKNYINKQRQDAVEHYKSEQLTSTNVSQQRELLLAYEEFKSYKVLGKKTPRISKQMVEDFLANYSG